MTANAYNKPRTYTIVYMNGGHPSDGTVLGYFTTDLGSLAEGEVIRSPEALYKVELVTHGGHHIDNRAYVSEMPVENIREGTWHDE